MERLKQVKPTEVEGAHYSLRLGFLKRNLWPRTHISSVYLYTNLPLEYVVSFKTRWMVRVNNCTVSPLSGKALYLQFLIHIDPKFFLKCGPEWVILIYGNMGFAYSSLFYRFFIVLPETTKSLILFALQLLAWYSLNHYLFWHTSGFIWKVGSRVCCTLKGHIHLFHNNHICVQAQV